MVAGGMIFAWSAAAPGQPDNTVASGQAITVNGSGGTLAFLVTSVDGASSGTGTVIYTDGSQQTFTLAAPDWYGRPAPGSDPAITASYRNCPNDTQDHTPVNVYYRAVALDPGKTVAVAILPRVSDGVSAYIPSPHVFAIGIG